MALRNDLTEIDVLTFTLAGCNAAEVAAYSGTSEAIAQTRMDSVLRAIGHPNAPKQTYSNRGAIA